MNNLRKSLVLGLGIAAGLLCVPAAQAAWTFNTSNCWQTANNQSIATGNIYGVGATVTCKDDANSQPQVEISAFGTSGNLGSSTFSQAQLGFYANGNGNTEFGVTSTANAGDPNTSNPNHAMDNSVGTELLLFDFAKAGYTFNMTNFLTGWGNGDSDVTVLAYTGGGSGPGAMAGKTIDQLVVSGGWTLVSNYNNTCNLTGCKDSTASSTGGVTNATTTAVSSGISSSWWIISAFNGKYANPDGTGDAFADYVKIASINGTGTKNKTPEPATLALMLVGLAGAVGTTRRRRS